MSTFDIVGDASRTLGTRVKNTIDKYRSLHEESEGHDTEARKARSQELANAYYDLATDFYERGWGSSFHFGAPRRGEHYREAIARHQHFVALRLGLTEGMRVLDVGSGVGGPARSIARFSGAHVTGLNNNAYQVERARALTVEAALEASCAFEQGDFMEMPFESASFDAAYQIEATCHAGDLERCYREVHRVLRPGALFGGYEWCLSPTYDAANEEHRELKKKIEIGNGLPDIRTTVEIVDTLTAAGFEVLTTKDATAFADAETPWYRVLSAGYDHPLRIRRTKPGRAAIHGFVSVLERAGIAPEGTGKISQTLHLGADALVRGGELGVFTPMFFTLARKKA
jgi:sterol 24-C-methyltransferase